MENVGVQILIRDAELKSILKQKHQLHKGSKSRNFPVDFQMGLMVDLELIKNDVIPGRDNNKTNSLAIPFR